MKSLISNYLNSRRSIRLEETIQDAVEHTDTDIQIHREMPEIQQQQVQSVHHQNNNNNTNKQQKDDCNRLESKILKLDLRYIDDNDTDSASIMSNTSQNTNSSDCEENQNKIDSSSSLSSASLLCSLSSPNQTQFSNSKSQYQIENLFVSLDRLNSNIESLLEKSNDQSNNLKKLYFNRPTNLKHNETLILDQVKSCLFFVNQFFGNQNTNPKMDCNNSNMSELLLENKILKDKIKSLEEKLKQNDQSELNRFKETFEIMRADRKRLKCEKLELLNQTKDLYKTIESKENQIKDILKNYENKTKETSQTVRKLIDSKVEIENEKQELEIQLIELIDEKNELNLIVAGKNATINKLQKQLNELKTKSPRYSLGKESDYGYSSSKSRDTLSSSMIETNHHHHHHHHHYTLKPSLTSTSSKQAKVKKEERSLKCKSNDSYIYIKNQQLNDSTSAAPPPTCHSKSKTKAKFKFSTKTAAPLTQSHTESDIKTSKSNNNLSFIMSTSDYETDLNKVLDSDEFIDLDDDTSANKTNTDKNDQKSTTSSSNSSSSVLCSSTTIASVSPSASVTSSSVSSYTNQQTTVKTVLNTSGDSSESSNSDLSPLLMSQSITLCEEDNLLNKTSNDYSNTTHYSIKQPLSMSMSMHTPSSNVKSRSSRIINTIIRMSTIGSSLTSSSTSNSINRSSTVIDPSKITYSSTLSSSKVHTSKSAYEVNETGLLNKSFKLLTLESDGNIDEWTPGQVRVWLENVGIPNGMIKNALKYIKNGKSLVSMSESELEKAFMITNHMHKRKLKLAIEDLKNPEKCKYSKLGEISTEWLVNVWLKDIGLVNLQTVFQQNLVDGRVLASLQKKDLEKYFGISKKNQLNSILLAIDLLRKYEFDIKKIKALRDTAINENQTLEISLWTNENFIDWLKLVNLQAFLPKLRESGIHGALVADSSFNIDYLYNCLNVDEEQRYQNMKKILEDEIKLLKKTKSNMKNDAFSRPLTSFKHDKQRIFTFRGSLGRALGKKIKRDISSPLIDDDTFKRIEFSHKIVDMKEYANTSAV